MAGNKNGVVKVDLDSLATTKSGGMCSRMKSLKVGEGFPSNKSFSGYMTAANYFSPDMRFRLLKIDGVQHVVRVK